VRGGRLRLTRLVAMTLQEIPASKGTAFMSGVTGAVFFGVSRTVMVQLPLFKEGGMWAAPSKILTWTDFWRATGPRAIGTIGCLVSAFAVAGAVKPHYDAGVMQPQDKITAT
jgi:hypothetical protein